MSGLSEAVVRGLTEAVQTLCQSRTHVVLVAEATVASGLPRLLAKELEGLAPVKLLSVDVRSQLGTIESVLGGFESNLILLVPDALSLEPAVLRRIGEVAARPGSGLRVVFFAAAGDIADPAGEIVQALGFGAAKIEIGLRPAVPVAPVDPRELQLDDELPPRVSRSSRPRAPRPIPVRTTRSARQRARRRESRGRGVRVAALLVPLVTAAAWVSVVGVPGVPLQLAPVAAPAPPEDLALPEPTPPPLELPALEPPPALLAAAPQEAAAPDPVEAARPPAPGEDAAQVAAPPPAPETAPIPRVAVNLNAHPWADIEVDGVAIGPTPIADWPLSPGHHDVRAAFPDGIVLERRIRVSSLENHFRIE